MAAFRYEFTPSAAKDLMQLTRKNQPLLHAITTEHIPAILADPHKAGEQKKGNLAGVRAYGFTVKTVAYRLAYRIEGDAVVFIAAGPHDAAYARAKRR